MSYKDFKVPYLSSATIKAAADDFRKKFCAKDIPVDVETAIEIKLKIEIIPIRGLRSLSNSDAMITANWAVIYVDEASYDDEANRIRFSLAHEIGHRILHATTYGKLDIRYLKDMKSFYEDIDPLQHTYFEGQANKFANYLLIPREQLVLEKQKFLLKVKPNIIKKITEDGTLNIYLAIPMSEFFGVSQKAAEIALCDI